MRSEGSSASWRASTRAPWKPSARHGAVWSLNGPRLGASAILLTYSIALGLAGLTLQHPGELGLTLGRCGNDLCIDWVMPAGNAWNDGARPGMRVVALNGQDARDVVPQGPLVEAVLVSKNGSTFVTNVKDLGFSGPLVAPSLWVAGALFALLGAVVLLRRPDPPVARLFAVFTGFMGAALGAAPAAGGPYAPWSLAVVFLSLIGMAASLPAFATAFVGNWHGPRTILRLFWLVGGVVMTGYLAALLIRPSLYAVVRVGGAMYITTGVMAALVMLARKAMVRNASRPARDARLALTGIACGMLPFVGLTLIPIIAINKSFMPSYMAAVLWGVIPVTFAYAILRHQVLGIRRLVHRGMVYGITTALLLAVIVLLVLIVDPLLNRVTGNIHPAWITAGLLTLGVLLFHILSRGVRRLVDRFYPDDIDSGTLLAAMRYDLLESEQMEEVASAIAKRLKDSLRLESVILFLGATDETVSVASAGPRADETLVYIRPRLLDPGFGEDGLAEIWWNSDHLLIARLEAGGEALGFLALGPKEKGEVFVREERRLVASVTPILALAIRETRLLAELREVSERLTNAEEAERGRIARDLHDGPLQKAILLGGAAEAALRDRHGVARELVSELRELCARLRPAILDDLGLVPALEWLLEQTAQGFTVTPRLTLRGMTEDDRLEPGAELALFRVTQESVSNALKHGHATSIHVTLTRTINGIELSVTDDGNGVLAPLDGARGLGISGMRERLRQVGGSVSVASDGRTGTMVSARIPAFVHGEQ